MPAVTFQVIPRELAFYGMFDRAADGVVEGARELAALVNDLPARESHAARIHDLEHAGLLRMQYGVIEVVDLPALQARSHKR